MSTEVSLRGAVMPSGVAETAHRLTCQVPSAWSFEVEARPFAESW